MATNIIIGIVGFLGGIMFSMGVASALMPPWTDETNGPDEDAFGTLFSAFLALRMPDKRAFSARRTVHVDEFYLQRLENAAQRIEEWNIRLQARDGRRS